MNRDTDGSYRVGSSLDGPKVSQRTRAYIDEVETLDRLLAEQRISQAEFDVRRAMLLAEASHKSTPALRWIAIMVTIPGTMFVLYVLANFITTFQ